MPIGLVLGLIAFAAIALGAFLLEGYLLLLPAFLVLVILTLTSMKVDGWRLKHFRITWLSNKKGGKLDE